MQGPKGDSGAAGLPGVEGRPGYKGDMVIKILVAVVVRCLK